MLAEVSCLMLFGVLEPYFWKKKSQAATHYAKVIKQIKHWKFRERHLFNSLNTVFYHVYIKYAQQKLAEKIANDESFMINEQHEFETDTEDDFVVDVKHKLGFEDGPKRQKK